MMGGLRAFAQSWAGKIVLIFLAFMLLGTGVIGSIGLFTNSRVSSGINADGQSINELEIAQEARGNFYQIGQTFEQIGQSMDSREAFERFGLLNQVRTATEAQLVNEIAFKAQADKLGISAAQSDLSDFVRQTFTDPVTGQFNERTMARSLANQGLTERAYLRDISENLSSQRLFTAADDLVFDNNTGEPIAAVPSTVALAEFSNDWTRFDISYFAINTAGIDIATPTDEALQTILDNDPDSYQRPEYRSFVGIFMTPEDLVDSIEVSDEDIQSVYDEYVARAELSTEWHLRQLFVNDGDKAQAIVNAVRAGTAFAEAATKQGEGEPLDLGPRAITYGRDALNEAFTAATETGILDPIADGDRFALIEVYQIDAPEIQTAEDYRDTAIREIAAPQAGTLLGSRFDELDGLVGTLSLEDAAAQVELPIVSGTIAASGPDARVEGVPFNSKVSSEIFSAPLGQTGFRNTFGEEGLFIVRVDSSEDPRPMTFDEARSSLTLAFNRQAQEELLEGLGQAALAQIDDATSFAQYILDNGVQMERQDAMTAADLLRFSVPVDAIKGSSKGDIVSGTTNTGFNIVLIRDARTADPELDAEALSGIEFQLARQYDDELQRAFRAAVRETVNVNINNIVFDRAITSGLNAYLDLRSGGTGQVRLEGADAAQQTGGGL